MSARFTRLDAAGSRVRKSTADFAAVSDSQTGLIWLLDDPGSMAWADAKAWAKKLRALGTRGWRLPTLLEWVNGPVDYTRSNPAVDTTYFRGFANGWYWTSTVDAESPSDDAWLVDLRFGYVARNFQALHSYVRAVAAGQS
ncbi:MAG: DUF1566 domain-containing protein [Pseudomonadota bacterium]|nr:DUF1566 domain-containing protein [Pseudomonadota bacterium]